MDDLFDVVIVGAGSAGCALARRLTDDPRDQGRPRRSGRAAVPSVHLRPDGVLQAVGNGDRLGLRVGAATGHGRPSPSACRADACSAAPARSTAWSICAAPARTSTAGNRPGVPAGAGSASARPTSNSKSCVLPTVPDETHELSHVFIDAAMQAGFRYNPFFDDGDLEGCGWNRLCIHDGERQSSYRAFVEPVVGRRRTCTSITDADRRSDRGLERRRRHRCPGSRAAGSVRRLAAGEVVLCAGAYESPRLLMVSGIGPAQHLRDHDIEPSSTSPSATTCRTTCWSVS